MHHGISRRGHGGLALANQGGSNNQPEKVLTPRQTTSRRRPSVLGFWAESRSVAMRTDYAADLLTGIIWSVHRSVRAQQRVLKAMVKNSGSISSSSATSIADTSSIFRTLSGNEWVSATSRQKSVTSVSLLRVQSCLFRRWDISMQKWNVLEHLQNRGGKSTYEIQCSIGKFRSAPTRNTSQNSTHLSD